MSLLLVSMSPPPTMEIKLPHIIDFFLVAEHISFHVTHVKPGYKNEHCIESLTHLPSLPESNSTLRAPQSPATANTETIRDQIIVIISGGGGSLYLSYQLLLMKLFMCCGERQWDAGSRSGLWVWKEKKRADATKKMKKRIEERMKMCCEWCGVSHLWGRIHTREMVASLKASSDSHSNDED